MHTHQKNLLLTLTLLLTLLLNTGLAQEPWWNTQYQCRAQIENVQPGDNHITPFTDLDYLAQLCNITQIQSWTIVQNQKQLPTYTYGPNHEKTVIYNAPTNNTAWLYYTNKTLEPRPEYEPMTINSPTYGLPLSGTYHADNPYTYPPTPSTTRTASIPATHKKPIPSHTTP